MPGQEIGKIISKKLVFATYLLCHLRKVPQVNLRKFREMSGGTADDKCLVVKVLLKKEEKQALRKDYLNC